MIKMCPDCGGKTFCKRCRGKHPYCDYCHRTGICPICWGAGTVPDRDEEYFDSWIQTKLSKRDKKIYE